MHRLNDEVGADEPRPGTAGDPALGRRAQLRRRGLRGCARGRGARRRDPPRRRPVSRARAERGNDHGHRDRLHDGRADRRRFRSDTRCTTGRRSPRRRRSRSTAPRASTCTASDGRRWIDFSSQLMGVNIGHGDKRVAEAIARQAEKLPYISPFQAFEGRAVLGKRLAGLWPGDIEKTFFTLAGAEANENAIKMAKHGDRPPEGAGALPQLPRFDVRHDDAHRRSAALAERAAGDAGRRARARPLPRPAARIGRCADRARPPGGDDPARGPRHDRRVHPGDGHRHERHPDPARRLHAGRARAVHEVRHP